MPQLYEIAYFLAYREYVRRVDTDDLAKYRARAQRSLDDSLRASELDDDTGLPSWVAASGVGPADGSSPFG